MTIDIQIFEESGPVVAGRGTVTEVAHFCMSKSSDISHPYYLYPLRRPESSEDQTKSFTKYLFYKISGTYGLVKNVKISLSVVNKQANNTQLFYGLTNTYQEPSNGYAGNLMYLPYESRVWYPNFGDSPQTATSRPVYLNNQTVFTQYLVLQTRVNASTWNDVGNTPMLTLKLSLNEFE